MIPLTYFVLVWLVMLGLFLVMSLFSILQMLRFGLAHTGTYVATVGFVGLSLLVVLISLWFLSSTSLSSTLDMSAVFNGVFAPPAI